MSRFCELGVRFPALGITARELFISSFPLFSVKNCRYNRDQKSYLSIYQSIDLRREGGLKGISPFYGPMQSFNCSYLWRVVPVVNLLPFRSFRKPTLFCPALSCWSRTVAFLRWRPAQCYALPIGGAAKRKGAEGMLFHVLLPMQFRANRGVEDPSSVYHRGDSFQGPEMSTFQHPVSSLLQQPRPLFKGLHLSLVGSSFSQVSKVLIYFPLGLRGGSCLLSCYFIFQFSFIPFSS